MQTNLQLHSRHTILLLRIFDIWVAEINGLDVFILYQD